MTDVKVIEYANDPRTDKEIFIIVEDLPEFPGGNSTMYDWIRDNTKYPGEAVKSKIEGKIFVVFTVNEKGKIKNIKVPDPVHPMLDAEAIRVIGSMPDWKPGKQEGKPVSVQLKVPVIFKLK
jgi:periplasmic protein TonB